MKIKIRAYTNEAQLPIAEFICGVQREFAIEIGIEEQPDLLNIQNVYQQSGGNFWVAYNQGEIIGTIALAKLSENNGALKKMFVAKQYRKLKVGAALLENLLTYAAEEHYQAIYLGTNSAFEAAQHFYRKNGFKEIQQSELPTDFPALGVDNRFYQKVLNQK